MVTYRQGLASDKLRRLQTVQLDLAARFVSYCQQEGLHPFLAAGSALGAQRDGGMIDWDDDIDFGMLRPEYETLIARLITNPMPGVVLQCSRTTPDYPYTFAKLRLDGTGVKEHLPLGAKFHNGIFIDIFPYDALPRGGLRQAALRTILTVCNFFVLSFNRQLALGATRPLFRQMRLLAMAARPVLPINALAAFREWSLRRAWYARHDRLTSYHMYGLRDSWRTEIGMDALMPPRIVPFGKYKMPAPADCHTYLTQIFGDYEQLPSPETRRPSHIADVDFGERG